MPVGLLASTLSLPLSILIGGMFVSSIESMIYMSIHKLVILCYFPHESTVMVIPLHSFHPLSSPYDDPKYGLLFDEYIFTPHTPMYSASNLMSSQRSPDKFPILSVPCVPSRTAQNMASAPAAREPLLPPRRRSPPPLPHSPHTRARRAPPHPLHSRSCIPDPHGPNERVPRPFPDTRRARGAAIALRVAIARKTYDVA